MIFIQFLIGLSLAAPSIDTSSQGMVHSLNLAAVTAAAKQMSANLMAYYTKSGASNQGVINPSSAKDATGFQWYEGGIMWGVMMEYMKTTGDLTYATAVVNALTLGSYGTVGSFLGTDETLAVTLEGKWNDDILWWGLGPVTGAEMFGTSTSMPGGLSYGALANNTYNQVFAQYDPTCQGGLWWSRDRSNPQSASYKSTITQCQEMLLGARLAILTGNNQYISQGQQLYNWMKTVGIVTSDFTVYDGLDTKSNTCSINGAIFSYQTGFLTGALAWMYQATKTASFISDANSLFTAALTKFAPNNIVTDPCETGNSCALNSVSTKGTMLRGWGYLNEFTTSSTVKNQLKSVLRASVDAMLQTCDSNLNCGNNWSTKTFTSSNVHFQMNSMELITTYLKTFTNGPIGKSNSGQAPSSAPAGQNLPPSNGGLVLGGSVFVGGFFAAFFMLFI